jgi:predicted transposase YbfD/YdcC
MNKAEPALGFQRHFRKLRDPRPRACCADYRFLDLLFIAFSATVAGADDWHAIETFARQRRDWLAKYCELPEGRTPSHDTFERLFQRLDPVRFGKCFSSWTAGLANELGLKHVAIDGKTSRGSAREGLRALHLVSAWAVANHLSLGQVACEAKSNEITAIPRLLELLELKGALVSIDAMGCQKEIAKKIVERGADYVLEAKGNQERLRDDIAASVACAEAEGLEEVKHDTFASEEKGHGRLEKRRFIVLYDTSGIRDKDKWEKLSAVGMCIRERLEKGKTTIEIHYFIGSRVMSASDYALALRGHWGIENNLHWQLDVSFHEDDNRTADRNACENLSLLRRLALAHLKRLDLKKSIKNKRYAAALDTAVLEKVLSLGQPG